MKTLMVTLFAFLVCCSSSWGQIDSPVKEETKSNSKGAFNALIMDLPGTTGKGVNKAWGKFVKKFKGKTKFDRKMNEHFTDDASIKDLSDNTVDILAKIEERGAEGTVITVWFNLGVSYLSSKEHPERYPAAEKILKEFANAVSADMIEEELKDAQKKLKELEDALKKLEKDQADKEKTIVDAKETIRKMEELIKKSEGEIVTCKELQAESKLTIEEQKKIIDDIQKRLDSVK